jgi:hypothetical protein
LGVFGNPHGPAKHYKLARKLFTSQCVPDPSEGTKKQRAKKQDDDGKQ